MNQKPVAEFLVWHAVFSTVCVIVGVLYLTVTRIANGRSQHGETLNERPIIGVLAQEQSTYLNIKYPGKFTSYIAASYVKAIESSGARVVPIMIGKDRDYYKDLMSKLNGVLLPGGGTYFTRSGGYADAGRHIYEIALEFNADGDYFPVFGTCLGFELLIVLALGEDKRVKCHSFGNTKIKFTPDFRSSRMYHAVSEEYTDVVENQDVTVNAHNLCILDENMESLSSDWRVMAHGSDKDGLRFVSIVEHKRYPFYGTQFHSEKISFEWKPSKQYPHSYQALDVNRYYMDFFVQECRRSQHNYSSLQEENDSLIYNYAPYFTGAVGSVFEQCYMFS